jgi:hypothetical protein
MMKHLHYKITTKIISRVMPILSFFVNQPPNQGLQRMASILYEDFCHR